MDKMLDTVIDLCHQSIWTDPEVMPYVKARGLTDETIRSWKLGAFPENINLLFQLYTKISAEKNSGYIVRRVDQYLESPFLKNRFIIPVNSTYGGADAIIGRATIAGDLIKAADFPKYYNTPYRKTRSLFGLDRAIPYAIASNQLFIVEGNMDVIQSHQAGLCNVVAASSASFSRHQLFLAARYASNIVLAFDNDEAGQMAIESIMKKYSTLAKKLGVTLSSLKFSGGKDLDEVIATGGIPW
jgi:DNA primase